MCIYIYIYIYIINLLLLFDNTTGMTHLKVNIITFDERWLNVEHRLSGCDWRKHVLSQCHFVRLESNLCFRREKPARGHADCRKSCLLQLFDYDNSHLCTVCSGQTTFTYRVMQSRSCPKLATTPFHHLLANIGISPSKPHSCSCFIISHSFQACNIRSWNGFIEQRNYSRVSFCDGSFYDDSLLRPLSSRTEHSRFVVHRCRNSTVLSLLSALLAFFRCARVSSFSI